MRIRNQSSTAHHVFIPHTLQYVLLACMMLALSACDPGAERRAAAIRAVGMAATIEDVTDAVRDAETEMQQAAARIEAHRHALEITTRVVAKSAEASARRKRVEDGLQRLADRRPSPDMSKDLDCERYGYPCKLGQEHVEAYQRSLDLAHEGDERREKGATADELLEWLLSLEDMESIWMGPSGIRFRITGATYVRVMWSEYRIGDEYLDLPRERGLDYRPW